MNSSKAYTSEGQEQPASHIGATLEALALTIASRAEAGADSYTYRLLHDEALLLSKVVEEAAEVQDAALSVNEPGGQDHLRYEAADVLYHLLVVLEQHGISLDELAAELNMRMTDEERPEGALLLYDEFINRGK